MKWRGLHRRRRRDEDPDVQQARRALAEARARLAETCRQGQEVTELADELRDVRRRNHLGPMILDAMGGRGARE